MKMLRSNITGVIMAGGKSSRMGTDKGLMDFQGKPMIQYGIDLLSTFFKTVVISTNQDEYSQFGLTIIPDIHKNCGPIGGLHAVLSEIETEYAFLLSCDMPFVSTEVILKIVDASEYQLATVPVVGGKMEPLCALYSVQILPKIQRNIDNRNFKMMQLIQDCHPNFIDFDEINAFLNFNSKSDLLK